MVADMVADIKANMVADMEVDKVADMVADMGPKKSRPNFTFLTKFHNFDQISQF